MSQTIVEYISIGGNRHSAAADWSGQSGQFAFGADQYVAVWRPLHPHRRGILALLKGHTAKVSAVKFTPQPAGSREKLATGSTNGELCLWQAEASGGGWTSSEICRAHDGAVNAIAVAGGSSILATGGADATVKLWKFDQENFSHLHTIKLTPRYIPLTLTLGTFGKAHTDEGVFLAVGGTSNTIQVFALTQLNEKPQHELHAILAGHEGWVRSMSLRKDVDGDLLLASASHDKHVRLWRLTFGDLKLSEKLVQHDDAPLFEQTLTAKVQTVSVPGAKYSITFEALLLGHEDWIYSASWSPSSDTLQLLTASADGSLTVWEPDPASGIWVSSSRLGEISGQKGATTATGSAGGFWSGVWSPDGGALVCLGRTGSWRLWEYDRNLHYWVQKPGVSGHFEPCNGIAWSLDGSYLLSTGSDQTTRLHAEWRRGDQRTWHEFGRPQIHGYDMNCVTSVSPSRFVSGADEKLLRVFDEPRAVATMLQRLCRFEVLDTNALPDVATMPVLGLSNKAVDGTEDSESALNGEAADVPNVPHSLDIEEPPTEDVLARHTLWPEHEKLYGHGYEISAAAVDAQHHKLLATACKASSLDHAVIRLYSTTNWHEIKAPLSSHSLTVTSLAFSKSSKPYLLSVGRDRQWTVFSRETNANDSWRICQSNAKAHSRMILDCAWSPIGDQPFFATAGRDKAVKIWATTAKEDEVNFTLRETLKHDAPVTALSFTEDQEGKFAFLAVGEEDGQLSVHAFGVSGGIEVVKSVKIEARLCPSKAINGLEWRPSWENYVEDGEGVQLAVAAADGSVRILRVDVMQLCGTG